MSRREDIDNAIWSDPDFHDLTAPAKLVYLWSFTNPRCGMSGLYKCSESMICFETALSPPATTVALEDLEHARFVFYMEGVIWVRGRVKHLRTKTVQIAKSIAMDLSKLGPNHLVNEFLVLYGDEPWITSSVENIRDFVRVERPSRVRVRVSSGSSVEETAETLDARVRDLFDYWREKCGHPAAKLTAERRRKIAARLHEGYSPEQVREGIDGAAKAPFVNEQGHRFDDIELVCRNGVKLEQFIGRVQGSAGRSRAERGADGLAAIRSLMENAA